MSLGTRTEGLTAPVADDRWSHWPVYWHALWVGALTALAIGLIIGLIGIAVGAHEIGPGHRVVSWHDFGIWALVFSVVGAFFAFVAGGWVAARVAGILRSEPAMLHGAIVWLLTVPMFLAAAGLGAGSFFGWHGGLGGSAPAWYVAPAAARATVEPPGKHATADERAAYDRGDYAEYEKLVTARATRNSALGAVTALLLGLVGSVLGGWMASGEPMHPFYFRNRHLTSRPAMTATPAPAAEATFQRTI